MNLTLTKGQWLIMTCVCTVCFTTGISFSLQGPIYPKEASKKGASAWEYGFVFGIFELVNFIVCPIYGKYMDILGTKCLLVGGTMFAGFSTIMFGFLTEVDILSAFLSLSFVLRIMEALGTSAAFTASFSVTAMAFKKSVATAYAIIELFFGLGFTIGPTVGGYLYQVGGFLCPFMVIGVVMVVVSFCLIFALSDVDSDVTRRQGDIWSAITLRPVMLDLFSVFAVFVSIGFYMATLEPHLRQFDLSPVHVGAIFAIDAATYMISTPIVGRLCDTSINPKNVIVFGSVLTIVSASLIGPLPFLPIPTTLWMVYLGMVVHGLATSCIMVPAFIDAIHSAVKCGMTDSLTTYGLLTGLSTSAVALGAFVGPVIGGILFDTVGFRWGTLVIIVVFMLLFVVMTWFVCVEWGTKEGHPYTRHDSKDSVVTAIANSITAQEYGSTMESEGAADGGINQSGSAHTHDDVSMETSIGNKEGINQSGGIHAEDDVSNKGVMPPMASNTGTEYCSPMEREEGEDKGINQSGGIHAEDDVSNKGVMPPMASNTGTEYCSPMEREEGEDKGINQSGDTSTDNDVNSSGLETPIANTAAAIDQSSIRE